MPPPVDFIIVFRANSASKQESKDCEVEYLDLIKTLKNAGLNATGKRGAKYGQILLFISTPQSKLESLLKSERRHDFVHGLSSTSLPEVSTPAERLRIIHTYITAPRSEGGLGIAPGSPEWNRVEDIMTLHDKEFNKKWIKDWTRKKIGFGVGMEEIQRIKVQYGEAIAQYFAFLSAYTRFLIVPGILGTLNFFFAKPFSPIFSFILLLWSVTFVEYWNIRERILSVKWGTYGIIKVERKRAQWKPHKGESWWVRELKMALSLPVIGVFGGALAALLTSIFIIEAFVTQLYHGPYRQYISFLPTVLFILLVPRLLAFYQSYAKRLTDWENHIHQSTHDRSLTLKTFALSGLVAYGGLVLSAFVYAPYGEKIMQYVHATLSDQGHGAEWLAKSIHLDDTKAFDGKHLINPNRLQNQMFAYTVTNQVINTFIEIGLPFIMRGVEWLKGKGEETVASKSKKNKRVEWEDEKVGEMSKEEREFLETARSEVCLPDYELFADYAEMVTQFGYVVLWSTCWPLSPLMALLNNWLELRSDAFKITAVTRKPIPSRIDTMGAWLDSLSFITWLGALTNTALVFLFYPTTGHTFSFRGFTFNFSRETRMTTALLLALTASHGYILFRAVVRHILERALWKGSEEEKIVEGASGRGSEDVVDKVTVTVDGASKDQGGFWVDNGVDEIRRTGKTE